VTAIAVLALIAALLLVPRVGHVGRFGANASMPERTASNLARPTTSVAESPKGSRSGQSRLRVIAGIADAPWLTRIGAATTGHTRPGSNPMALPADLLIVDKLNNRLIVVDPQGRIRWQFPRHGDLRPGETFSVPDDAFFSPDGREIVATQEDDSVMTVIDVPTHRIVYRYGVPGEPGSSANHLSNPDDAMMLPDGDLLVADIKNCRIMLVAPPAHRPLRIIGITTTACRHAPPQHWGSPNGVFPIGHGRYLVTEINGDWVDAIDLNGTVFFSTHPPGVNYPSDSTMITPNRYLTVDYSSPGQVVIFDRTGRLLWRWTGTGSNRLNHPSLALALPDGDIVATDDYNHRVVVIDPRSNRIVWQYGITGMAGSAPGMLDNPDGLDLVPPFSYLDRW
jgi:DNA-binding beta-propeller fold protein YncE